MSGTDNVTAAYSSEYLHEYNGESLRAVAILFIVLVTICVSLRFYARRLGAIRWGLDDTLIIPGTFFCLAVCACSLADLSFGSLGYHQVVVSDPEKLVLRAKFVLAVPLLYLAAVLFPKLAILAIYMRIFTTSLYRYTCWALAVFLIVNWVTFTVAAFLMCTPFEYLWNKTIPGGHCLDLKLLFLWSAFPNIVTDLVMLVLPLPVVWKLNTSRNTKIGLTITFVTGSIGLLTSVLRFAAFFFHSPTSDGPRAAVYLYIFVICECCMYLIAACLLTYRPLARLFRKDGPLSIACIGAKFSSQRQSYGSRKTSNISSPKRGSSESKLVKEDRRTTTKTEDMV